MTRLFHTGILLLLGSISAAQAQVSSLANTGPRSSGLDEAAIGAAVPHQNPLPAPSSDLVKSEVGADLDGAGASATRGARSRVYGSFGIPYTSTRVVAGASTVAPTSPNYLASTFPYRAVGRLSFTTASGGTAFCSASVIKRGLIVTAAHCVQRFGGKSTLYRNWVFTPAYYAPGASATDKAPYGNWNWASVTWPTTWNLGTDTGSGSARNNDLAVFILQKNSAGKFIGDVVGQLGYGWGNYSFTQSPKTGNLSVAAVSTVGFPGLLDQGGRLQRADDPSYLTTVSGANQIWQGNDFTGGSSGGPWIVNFYTELPARSGGAVNGSAPKRVVVGVTSWGSSDPNAPKDNYSSRFGVNKEFPAANYGGRGAGNIGSLINYACTQKLPGSTQTYAAAGYCS